MLNRSDVLRGNYKRRKNAEELAGKRILERVRLMEKEEPLLEYRFTMTDMWSRKVFVALLRRYGIKPYRYSRQKNTDKAARQQTEKEETK